MFIVEGNIGAGKSTFLRLVGQQLPQLTIDLEPVDRWQQELFGRSLLSNFYHEPKRWAYTMESFTLMVRMADNIRRSTSLKAQQLRHAPTGLLVERSIYSGRYCFAQNSHASGFMSDLEWELYVQMFDFLTSARHNPLYQPPHGFIYLRTSPAVSAARTQRRNRSGEAAIPLSYLTDLAQRHDQFLIAKANLPANLQAVPVLVLDADCDFETDAGALQKLIEQLQNFLGF